MQHPRAVSEQALELDRADQLGHALEHVVVGESAPGRGHHLVVGGAAAGGLVHLVADEREGLRVRQPPALRPAAAGELGGGEDRQAIQLGRGQAHGSTPSRGHGGPAPGSGGIIGDA